MDGLDWSWVSLGMGLGSVVGLSGRCRWDALEMFCGDVLLKFHDVLVLFLESALVKVSVNHERDFA